MSQDANVHYSIQKPTLYIGLFNYICWALGVVIVIGGVELIHSLKMFFPGIAVAFMGTPVKGHGSLPGWLFKTIGDRMQFRKLRRRRQKDRAVLVQAPLNRTPGEKGTSKIEQPQLVIGKIRSADGSLADVPLLTTTDRKYLTVVLATDGASNIWLDSDTEGKFNSDLAWLGGMSRAVSLAKSEELDLVTTRSHRPKNKEQGLAWNRSRGNPRIMAAATADEDDIDESADGLPASDDQPPYTQAEVNIGRNAIDRHVMVRDIAGDSSHHCFLRMPWPTNKLGRKISVSNPDAFRKSELFRVIQQISKAYSSNQVPARLLTVDEMRSLWARRWRLAGLDTYNRYEERDREYAAVRNGQPHGAQVDLETPITFEFSAPGPEAWVDYEGTYIAAGYVERVEPAFLYPEFQQDNLVLGDDVHYTIGTYNKMPLLKGDKNKARWRERIFRATMAENPLDRHLSTPEADVAIDEIVEQRKRLVQGSKRSSHYLPVAYVLASSPEEATEKWDDLADELTDVYSLKRATNADDIIDIVMALIGLRTN